jgi:hypothetical protein
MPFKVSKVSNSSQTQYFARLHLDQRIVLSDHMKNNGFPWKRASIFYIPIEHLPAGRARIAFA